MPRLEGCWQAVSVIDRFKLSGRTPTTTMCIACLSLDRSRHATLNSYVRTSVRTSVAYARKNLAKIQFIFPSEFKRKGISAHVEDLRDHWSLDVTAVQ